MMQFEPVNIAIEAAFWFKLVELKLNKLKLSEDWQELDGFLSLGSNVQSQDGTVISMPSKLTLPASSLNNERETPNASIKVPLAFKNFNMIEDFKNCDKQALLEREIERVNGN